MKDFIIVTKTELNKLFKRKDSWLMLTVLIVPILYSVGLAFRSSVITYAGAGNITAVGFTSAMFQMSQSMFIFNVILASIIGRSLAAEIDNTSIRLFVNRIGNRRLIYLGKEAALLLYSVFVDVLLALTSIVFYYAVLCRNKSIASGIFYDSNVSAEIAQISCVCIFWLLTIFLVMFLSTRLKTLVCAAVYMIGYIVMNLISYVNGIKYLSPLYYVTEVSGDNSLAFMWSGAFLLYLICAGIMFTYLGAHRLEKMDL